MKKIRDISAKLVIGILNEFNCINLSIKWKLILVNLAIITPVTLMTIFLFINVFSTLEKENSEYTIQIMKQINANIENIVNEMDNISMFVSAADDVREMLKNRKSISDDLEKKTQSLIKQLKGYRNIVADVLVVSRDMEIINSTYEGWIGNYRLLGPSWINKVFNANGQKVLISGYQVSKQGDSYDTVICLARSIFDESGNVIGMTLIEVSLEKIKSVCNNVQLGEHGFIALLDHNGYAIYNTNESEIGSSIKIENIKNESNGSYQIGYVNDEEMMITYEASKYTGMTVAGFIPLNEIFKHIRKLRNIVFIAETVLFFLAIIISIFMSFNISKPIIKMRSLMKRVELGDFTISTEIKRKDEIGQLGRSFNIMVKKINDLIDTLYKSRLREKEAELNELRAKINPHFLYNTLEVISMTAYLNNDNKVVEMLNALAKLFRNSASNGRGLISIRQEISHVDNYVYLQKISNNNKFDLIWEVGEKAAHYMTMGFILQPVVENSIRHGFKDLETGGYITISIFEFSHKLVYRVKDNGSGMDEGRLNEILSRINVERRFDVNSGIGLNNINSRIKLLFGEEFGISLWNNPDKGITVEIAIPVIKPKDGGFNICLR